MPHVLTVIGGRNDAGPLSQVSRLFGAQSMDLSSDRNELCSLGWRICRGAGFLTLGGLGEAPGLAGAQWS